MRPPLPQVEIASPCSLAWESMPGDERVRHCSTCRQNVYNVEALTQAEALRLISSRGGRACLRLYRRPDGTVVTQDCWSRLRAAGRRGLPHLLIALFLVGWAELTAMASGLSQLRTLWRAARPRPLELRPTAFSSPPPAPAGEEHLHTLGRGVLRPASGQKRMVRPE